MFVSNLNPVFLQLGPISIYYYSFAYIFGFAILYYLLEKHKNEFNLTSREAEDFVFYLLLGVIIGARLFEVVIWEPGYYFSNPAKIIAIWEGGLSLHGGFIGAVLAGYFFCKKNKVNFWKMADFIVVPTTFALALGRIGNFINGEIVGTLSNLPWCVIFPKYEGCRHPVQLYGAIGRFFIFGILMLIKKYKKFKDGFLFWTFVLLIGFGRFFADFLREDPRYFGLSTGQYLSLAIFGVSLIVIFKLYKEDIKNLFKK